MRVTRAAIAALWLSIVSDGSLIIRRALPSVYA
jgi:hypothetical protein